MNYHASPRMLYNDCSIILSGVKDMNETISNEYLRVTVRPKGAELQSIVSQKSGVEYLWQGDPAYWEGRAPVLFPIVGRLAGMKYRYRGREYEMSIHGFAKDSDFVYSREGEDAIRFTLADSEETRKLYPFSFQFEVAFRLEQSTLIVDYIVKNRTDGEMLFSMGAHEGYRCPREEGECFEDYELVFSETDDYRTMLVNVENGLMTGETSPVFEGTTLGLTHKLFENDALVFGNIKSKMVRLQSRKSKAAIEVTYEGADNLGIWTRVGAPYVCIEPWCGMPDYVGSAGELTQKQGIIRLENEGECTFTHQIKVVE